MPWYPGGGGVFLLNNTDIKNDKLPLMVHAIYFMLSATFVFFYYQKVVDRANFADAKSIDAVVTFMAAKPYQFRLLSAFIIKALSFISFISIRSWFVIYSTVVVYLLLITYRHFLMSYVESKLQVTLLSPVILYPMAWNYILLNQSFQFYDFTAILFFTLGMLFIIREDFKRFLIIFPFAILNKETAAYLIFVYLFYNYKSIFTSRIILRTVLLTAIFLAIKTVLAVIFEKNQGDIFEICLPVNMEIISNLFLNRVYLKNIMLAFGGMYIFVVLLFLTGKWKLFSRKEKVYMNLAFIPYFVIGIFVCYFTEVRVYIEIIPMFTTLFIVYLTTTFGLKLQEAGDK